MPQPPALLLHPYPPCDLLTRGSQSAAPPSCLLPRSTPGLERQVQLRRWSLPWQAVTLFDPLLQPLRRGFFRQTVRPPAAFPPLCLGRPPASCPPLCFGHSTVSPPAACARLRRVS